MYTFEKVFHGPNAGDYRIYRTGTVRKVVRETHPSYTQFVAENGIGAVTVIPYVPPTLEDNRTKALDKESTTLTQALRADFTSTLERDSSPLVFPGGNQFAEIEASNKVSDSTVTNTRSVRDADLKIWEITKEEHQQLVKEQNLFKDQQTLYTAAIREQIKNAVSESEMNSAEADLPSYSYAAGDFTTSAGEVNTERLLAEVKVALPSSTVRAVVHRDTLTTVLLSAPLIPADETILGGVIAAHDGSAPSHTTSDWEYWKSDPIVTDPLTGLSAPFSIMQPFVHRRDLYNDSDSPIYIPGHTSLLGPTSSVQNLNDIHGKLGWHGKQVAQALYQRPRDLLIYYANPNTFNYGTHLYSNEKVAQDMAQYGLVVLGDGVANSGHADYANTIVIAPRIKALNPSCQIFGYVSVSQSLVDFQDEVDEWDTLGVDGILLDRAGYEYGTVDTNGRAAFNAKVDYVHGKTNACVCFANAWNADHVIGVVDDPVKPNSTYNPSEVESNLNENDWYLLESFPINTTEYTDSDPAGYETKYDWSTRGVKAQGHRATYGINLAAVGVIDNGNAGGQDLFDFLFVSAAMFSLDAVGSSDTSYGSGSSTVDWWLRLDVSKMGALYSLNAAVQVDVNDANVYWRYVDFGRFKLDFSDGSYESLVDKR